MINMLSRLFSVKEIVLKKGAIVRLRFLSGKKAVLFYGKSSLEKSGHLEKIKTQLTAAKLETVCHDNINGDPTKNEVEKCCSILNKIQPDIIIACGGGAVIDTIKLARIFYENPSLQWASVEKPFSISSLVKRTQLIAIPTTSGTGAEVSISAVIKDEAKNTKTPVVSPELLPELVILDPNLTLDLPPDITLYTAIDAFTHAFEAFCSKLHNPLIDTYAVSAGSMIVENIEKVLLNPHEIEAREKLLYAAMLAGQAQNVTSVGAIHALSHTVGAHFNLSHGLMNALFLPVIAKSNAEQTERPLLFLQKVGLNSLENLYSWVNQLLNFVGMGSAWQKLIPHPEIIDYANLAESALADVCMRTNPRSYTANELIDILKEPC